MSTLRACALLGCSWLVALAACGGEGGSTDVQPTLRFADRTDAELVRLIDAAGGTDLFRATGMIDQFGDTFEVEPCPTITIAGSVATVTGGCARADGTRLEGSGAVDNPIGWDQLDYRFQDDTLYTFTQFGLGDGQATQTFDGWLRRTDGLATWDADLTASLLGVTVRSDLYIHCTDPQRPSCAFTNIGLELVGVGGARVSGTVTASTTGGGQQIDLTLQGADRLTVRSTGTCLGWQIEGTTRGRTCP